MTESASGVSLMLGDTLERMREIPDGSVDMVMADLPYGTTACKWDTIIPFEPLWAAYRRVCKKNAAIVLTASQPFTSVLVMSNPNWFRYEWIWDKRLSTGFLDANRKPLKRHESVLVFSGGRTIYNPEMRTGVMRNKGGSGPSDCYGKYKKVASRSDQYYPTSLIEISNANQSAKVHPTQKPVALMEYLIRTYTNKGETVLDNTMGSGTTGVACVNTGRKFIGVERDEEYMKIAESRIAAATNEYA